MILDDEYDKFCPANSSSIILHQILLPLFLVYADESMMISGKLNKGL